MSVDNRFLSPRSGLIGWIENRLANAERLKAIRRAVFSRLPFPVLESDVRDVVYANWSVPVSSVRPWIPQGIEVLERDGRTILTVLTYVHGGFGPALAGPLRRLFPSPKQSNWRLYVGRIDGVAPTAPTVLFLKNVFDNPVHALGTRVFSDALPSHAAGRFVHEVEAGQTRTEISGAGSAPSMALTTEMASDRTLDAGVEAMFGDWAEAVETLSLQDAAVAMMPGRSDLAWAAIDLPIDPTTLRPLKVTGYSPGPLLEAMGATGAPFCFLAPKVRFRVLNERIIRR